MLDNSILERFFDSVNQRDLERMGELFKESAEFYFPKTQPLIGKDRIKRFFKILFRQYPELLFSVQRTIVQGGKAAVHWTNKGRNRKGEDYKNEGVTVFEEQEGLISYMSDFFKDTEKF